MFGRVMLPPPSGSSTWRRKGGQRYTQGVQGVVKSVRANRKCGRTVILAVGEGAYVAFIQTVVV